MKYQNGFAEREYQCPERSGREIVPNRDPNQAARHNSNPETTFAAAEPRNKVRKKCFCWGNLV